MAIYVMRVGIVARSGGGNAVAAASYAIGTPLVDETTGVAYSYGRAERVIASGTVVPEGAPEALLNPQVLWSAAEAADPRANAQPARREIVAIPRELTDDEAIALIEERARYYAAEGHCVTWAVHDLGTNNPHGHLLITTRRLSGKPYDAERPGEVFARTKSHSAYLVRDPEGAERWMTPAELKAANDGGAELAKVYRWIGPDGESERLTVAEGEARGEGWARRNRSPVSRKVADDDWDTKEALERWRIAWQDQANAALARHWESEGLEGEAPRIDRRSYAEQGIDKTPQMHEGPRPNDAVVAYNEAVRERNAIAARLADAVRDAVRRAAAWWRRRTLDPLTERRRSYARRQRRRGIAAARSVRAVHPITREQARDTVQTTRNDPRSLRERAQEIARGAAMGTDGRQQIGPHR